MVRRVERNERYRTAKRAVVHIETVLRGPVVRDADGREGQREWWSLTLECGHVENRRKPGQTYTERCHMIVDVALNGKAGMKRALRGAPRWVGCSICSSVERARVHKIDCDMDEDCTCLPDDAG